MTGGISGFRFSYVHGSDDPTFLLFLCGFAFFDFVVLMAVIISRICETHYREKSTAEAGLSVAPAEAGLSVAPAEAGLSVAPAEAGLSVAPAEAGLSVAPAEAGLSVVPAEAGLAPPP
ncbi:hypothetical protein L596_026470 [Steinernema carpocapsae]|uniref:Uncharacterized protein n=1 Tax=Steinernema carpocapsae TaxID=34508 RepID=A0A4U5M1G0_STECR|nr:hypothetical protein L596_026470 [Steinernema carpocapsae]